MVAFLTSRSIHPFLILNRYKTFLLENPSGVLSKDQFIADNMKQFGLSRECWEFFYSALDKVCNILPDSRLTYRTPKDKNGNIDFREWLIGMYIHQKGSLDEKLDRTSCSLPYGRLAS